MKRKSNSKPCNAKKQIREVRIFSEALKKRIVSDICKELVSVSMASREYGASRTTIYRWLYQYSPAHPKGVRQVVEMQSDTYLMENLQKRLVEAEQALGRASLRNEYLERLIEVASEELGLDLKKISGRYP